LDSQINEKELTEFFKKVFLSVISSRIIKDFSGKSKGFGFVNLSNYNEYMKMLNLNKPLILKGRILTIK
jgi:RNA recognition motif-containing protein